MIMNMDVGGGISPKKPAAVSKPLYHRGGSTATKAKAQPTVGIHNLLLSNS